MIIIDANLLIYAYNAADPHHDPSRRWFESALQSTEPVGLAWLVVLAFLRIVTSPRSMPLPLPWSQACGFVDEWLEQPVVEIVQPTPRHWTLLRDFIQTGQAPGNLTSDAHLAALAIEHGATLYSTDQDFSRFAGLKFVNPLA
jgi:toxin-antitoxin system PIN domain toxin